MKTKLDMEKPGEKDENGEPKSYEDYEIKNAHEDIMKAEAHKKKPKLMKAVAKHAQGVVSAIKSVKELRAHREKLNSKKDESPSEIEEKEEPVLP